MRLDLRIRGHRRGPYRLPNGYCETDDAGPFLPQSQWSFVQRLDFHPLDNGGRSVVVAISNEVAMTLSTDLRGNL